MSIAQLALRGGLRAEVVMASRPGTREVQRRALEASKCCVTHPAHASRVHSQVECHCEHDTSFRINSHAPQVSAAAVTPASPATMHADLYRRALFVKNLR